MKTTRAEFEVDVSTITPEYYSVDWIQSITNKDGVLHCVVTNQVETLLFGGYRNSMEEWVYSYYFNIFPLDDAFQREKLNIVLGKYFENRKHNPLIKVPNCLFARLKHIWENYTTVKNIYYNHIDLLCYCPVGCPILKRVIDDEGVDRLENYSASVLNVIKPFIMKSKVLYDKYRELLDTSEIRRLMIHNPHYDQDFKVSGVDLIQLIIKRNPFARVSIDETTQPQLRSTPTEYYPFIIRYSNELLVVRLLYPLAWQDYLDCEYVSKHLDELPDPILHYHMMSENHTKYRPLLHELINRYPLFYYMLSKEEKNVYGLFGSDPTPSWIRKTNGCCLFYEKIKLNNTKMILQCLRLIDFGIFDVPSRLIHGDYYAYTWMFPQKEIQDLDPDTKWQIKKEIVRQTSIKRWIWTKKTVDLWIHFE